MAKSSRFPKDQTYEEWLVEINQRNELRWQQVDKWWFATPSNYYEKHRGVFWHACKSNWLLDRCESDARPESCTTQCDGCGMVIPDGIKMIAGLLSW